MTPLERHELVRPDGPIRYWTGGRVDAPVLVFLHGATPDHRSWDAQRAAPQPRYRIVIPDLRAHGESMTADAFSFAAAVDDIVALLDDLDLDRIGLIGLSLGGNPEAFNAALISFLDQVLTPDRRDRRMARSRAVPPAARHW